MNGGLLGSPGKAEPTPFESDFDNLLWWDASESYLVSNVAGGSVITGGLGMTIQTSTTNNTWTLAKGTIHTASSVYRNPTWPGSDYQDINFSQKIWFQVKMYCDISSASNSTVYFRAQLGVNATTNTTLRLDRKGFGFEVNLGTYHLVAHNGTSVHVVNSGVAAAQTASNSLDDVSCYSDGNGNVELSVNGVVVARSSHGPVGAASDACMKIEIHNGTSGTAHHAEFWRQILMLFGCDKEATRKFRNLFMWDFNEGQNAWANSGSSTAGGLGRRIWCANSANSYYTSKGTPTSGAGQNPTWPGSDYQDINFSQEIWFKFRNLTDILSSSDSATYFRVQLGVDATTTSPGRLTQKGFGFEINLGKFFLLAHNGVDLDVVGTGVNPAFVTTGKADDVELYSDGKGNVQLRVNGVVVARSSHGPVGNGPASDIRVEITNGATPNYARSENSCRISMLFGGAS